jgi:hypothetical protein
LAEDFLKRIQEEIVRLRENGQVPARVRINTTDEARLIDLSLDGELRNRLILGGPRHALPTLFGLKIVWDHKGESTVE